MCETDRPAGSANLQQDDGGAAATSPEGGAVARPDVVDTVASVASCERNDIRYHVLDGCTRFQKEWVSQGIQYEVQDVAQGTLFDVQICGLNHASLVTCPV